MEESFLVDEGAEAFLCGVFLWFLKMEAFRAATLGEMPA